LDRVFKFLYVAAVISIVVSAASSILGFPANVYRWVGAPALFVAGWAFFGHLITMDNEFPGGWSNPDSDSRITLVSVRYLAPKLLVLIAVAFITLSPPWASS
jgi:hypothetical protein